MPESGLDAAAGYDSPESPTSSQENLRRLQDEYIALVASQATSEAFPSANQIEPDAPVTDAPSSDAEDVKRAELTGFGGFLIVILILLIVIGLGAGIGAIALTNAGAEPDQIAYFAWQFVFAVIYIALMLSKKRAARWYAIAYHLSAQIFIGLLVYGPPGVTALDWTATGGGGAFAAYWWFSKRVRSTYTL